MSTTREDATRINEADVRAARLALGKLRDALRANGRNVVAACDIERALATLALPAEACVGFVCGGWVKDDGERVPHRNACCDYHRGSVLQRECICANCGRPYSACTASRAPKPEPANEAEPARCEFVCGGYDAGGKHHKHHSGTRLAHLCHATSCSYGTACICAREGCGKPATDPCHTRAATRQSREPDRMAHTAAVLLDGFEKRAEAAEPRVAAFEASGAEAEKVTP